MGRKSNLSKSLFVLSGAALLLQFAGCACHSGMQFHSAAFHFLPPIKITHPRNPPCYYADCSFYGYHPTCWRPWPADWEMQRAYCLDGMEEVLPLDPNASPPLIPMTMQPPMNEGGAAPIAPLPAPIVPPPDSNPPLPGPENGDQSHWMPDREYMNSLTSLDKLGRPLPLRLPHQAELMPAGVRQVQAIAIPLD